MNHSPYTPPRWRCRLATLGLALALPFAAAAQISQVVFSDDFEDGTIDPTKFVADAPFFEGGVGTIAGAEGNGVLQFTGEVTQQWWAGATLRMLPTFVASEQTNIVLTVDRVSEFGVGTASRSAVWILDSTGSRYVLFADVRAEGGWRFNRKIGEAGDAPTGSGTDMVALNDPSFDDGGFHVMKVVANGKTVKLYVDDILGAEVKFPYSDLVFHLGSYARATGDFADTTFDNLKIEAVGTAVFGVTSVTVPTGQTLPEVSVTIPAGANATTAVPIRVISSNPTAATAVGAVAGTLTLNFEAGGPNTKTFGLQAGAAPGGSEFRLESDVPGLAGGNLLNVVVVEGPGVRLEDGFAGATLDAAKWTVNNQGFEVGQGEFTVAQADGRLTIAGNLNLEQYWGGASIRTVNTFTATKDLPLVVEVDRVGINRTTVFETDSTAARSAVFLSNADRTRYFFFSQNLGESGWSVNTNPGNPTGGGTAIAAFASLNASTNSHRIRLVADGEGVDVFLDGVFGGRFAFALSANIHVELGAYARALDDSVAASFDNARIVNQLPCLTVSPIDIAANVGQAPVDVTVTIPTLLNATEAVQVTLTSSAPGVVLPEGAVGGVRTLTFAAGASPTQVVPVSFPGVGTAQLILAGPPDTCVNQQVSVTVTPALVSLLSDDFSAPLNEAVWQTEVGSLDVDLPGTLIAEESFVAVTNGAVELTLTVELGNWPGYTVGTVATYDASPTAPITFEIDRKDLNFTLVTGTAAKQRTGVWVTDADRTRYVFFGELATHDGTEGGWRYNASTGGATDPVLPGLGIAIAAFSGAQFNDLGDHRMRVVANGQTVKLYLDGFLGAEVPFPVATGLRFFFSTYVQAATDKAVGIWDNAAVLGVGESVGPITATLAPNGDLTLTWTGSGTLESSAVLGTGAAWAAVTPAPTGNTITIPAAQLTGARYYRLIQ